VHRDEVVIGQDSLHLRFSTRRRSCGGLDRVEQRRHSRGEVGIVVSRAGDEEPFSCGAIALSRQSKEVHSNCFSVHVDQLLGLAWRSAGT
jgi:hypothetical protein